MRYSKTDAYAVARPEQRDEIGTDVYYGGVVFPRHASLDAGRYHGGLLDVALRAGATVRSHSAVESIDRTPGGFDVTVSGRTIRAGKVIIATNGYTGVLTPWQQRRVIPIGSYVIATEEIASDIMDQVMPKNANFFPTRASWFTTTVRRRIEIASSLAVACRSAKQTPGEAVPNSAMKLVRLFPELEAIRIRNSWVGFVAYTFDTLMHTGNGQWLVLGSRILRLRRRDVGLPRNACRAAGGWAGERWQRRLIMCRFPTRPFLRGKPLVSRPINSGLQTT